jgi:hypothetical protein
LYITNRIDLSNLYQPYRLFTKRLNINLSSLLQQIEDEDWGKTIISVQENESMDSEDVNARSNDNCPNDQ